MPKTQHLVPKIRPFIAVLRFNSLMGALQMNQWLFKKDSDFGGTYKYRVSWGSFFRSLGQPLCHVLAGQSSTVAYSFMIQSYGQKNRLFWMLCLRLPWDIIHTRTDRLVTWTVKNFSCPLMLEFIHSHAQNKHYSKSPMGDDYHKTGTRSVFNCSYCQPHQYTLIEDTH